jgi:hypothetical protein
MVVVVEVVHGTVHRELEAWVEVAKEAVIIILELYKLQRLGRQIQVAVAVEADSHRTERPVAAAQASYSFRILYLYPVQFSVIQEVMHVGVMQ